MPGLIRGVARTAAIAGTATAVSNRVSRRQAGRWASQEQQQYAQEPPPQQQQYAPPPPPPQTGMDDKLAQLKELGELKSGRRAERARVRAAEGPHPRRLTPYLRVKCGPVGTGRQHFARDGPGLRALEVHAGPARGS